MTRQPFLIGVNTFVWRSPLVEADLEVTLRTIAAMGYDAVELALEEPGDWDAGHARDLLDELRLRSVVGAVFPPGRDLVAAGAPTIEGAQAYLRRAIDTAAAQGSSLVIGPMSTSVGRTWRMTADERQRATIDLRDALRPLCDHACSRGIRLALEPLNRYETSFLNTAQQVLDVIEPLPAEAIGVNLDAYHMNIEEKSLGGALRETGDRLLHLQVSGNDRGAPGEDHIDWVEVREALRGIGYDGIVGFESFTSDNLTIATAASIWRPLASTQDELAERAVKFLRSWRSGADEDAALKN